MRKLVVGATLALIALSATAGDFFKKPARPVADESFLPVDEAFELQPLESRDGKLLVSWRIAPGYYLYRPRLQFKLLQPADQKLGVRLPAGEMHEDEHFGVVEVYRPDPQKANKLTAELPLSFPPSGAIKLQVGYQGCADAGLCYPPQTRTLDYVP